MLDKMLIVITLQCGVIGRILARLSGDLRRREIIICTDRVTIYDICCRVQLLTNIKVTGSREVIPSAVG